MDITIILLVIGLISLLASFLVGNNSRKYEDELEKVSISLHQETSGLKKRLKAVEEELMIGVTPTPIRPKNSERPKPVHEIIINQILSLHAQGYSIKEIAKRSSLSDAEVAAVLQARGVIG